MEARCSAILVRRKARCGDHETGGKSYTPDGVTLLLAYSAPRTSKCGQGSCIAWETRREACWSHLFRGPLPEVPQKLSSKKGIPSVATRPKRFRALDFAGRLHPCLIPFLEENPYSS